MLALRLTECFWHLQCGVDSTDRTSTLLRYVFTHDHFHYCVSEAVYDMNSLLCGSLLQPVVLRLTKPMVWCMLLQFRRNDPEAPSSHPGGPPGTTIGGGGNVRSRFRLCEPNQRRDQNQIASAIQASMDSANAEAAHRDARQQALAQVCPAPTTCTTLLYPLVPLPACVSPGCIC